MFKKLVLISLATSLLFLGGTALASGFGLKETAVKAGYQTTGEAVSVTARIQTVVSAILGVVALIFFGLTLYGGFIWLTARGKEEKVTEAKNILEAAAIGLAVIASSYALATFILSRLAQPTSNGCCYQWLPDSTSDTGVRLIPTPSNKEDCEADGGDFMATECPAQ